MNGEQRLSDIWICDLRTMHWQQIEQHGIAPLGNFPCIAFLNVSLAQLIFVYLNQYFPGRSLHSANLIQQKMYVFGGWVSAQGEEIGTSSDQTPKTQWKCSNDLCCFDLKTQKWQPLGEGLCDVEHMPKARAGHCSGKEIYS